MCWSSTAPAPGAAARRGAAPDPAVVDALARRRPHLGRLPAPVTTRRSRSVKTLISGIGCHIAIGPRGEVYVTWYDNQLNALMQVKSTNRGGSWSLPAPIATIQGHRLLRGRGVSQPLDPHERSRPAQRPRVRRGGVAQRSGRADAAATAPRSGRRSSRGRSPPRTYTAMLATKKANNIAKRKYNAGGDGDGPASGADIMLFKSTNGGRATAGPSASTRIRPTGDADQFQPWMAVTPSGQVNVMYFDRRDDPDNYYISTYLAGPTTAAGRSTTARVAGGLGPGGRLADLGGGKFIGDYQGLVVDDDVAIPFWNDTQLASPARSDEHRPTRRSSRRASPMTRPRRPRPPRSAASLSACGWGRARSAAWHSARRAARCAAAWARPPGAGAGLNYCVRGGGGVVAVLNGRNRVGLAATTARAHRRAGVGTQQLGAGAAAEVRPAPAQCRADGAPAPPVRAGHARAQRPVAPDRFRDPPRPGVTFVAVADRTVLRQRSDLARFLRLAGLARRR